MADEKDKKDKKDEAAPEEAPKAKGGKLKWILIGFGVIALLGGGGAGGYLLLSGGKKDAAASPAKAESAPPAVVNLQLDPFLVNLADPGGAHYLKATLTLELPNERAVKWINARLPRVRDSVLMLLSSKTSADLLSAEGKFKLRDDVLKSVNEAMGDDRASAVYLTEFVVQ
jgi:flagellar FliL protein